MKNIIIFLLILTFSSSYVIAQDEEEEVRKPKRVGLAIAEVAASNILIWSFNRYIREDNYSFMIGWRTVEMNLRHGFEWDPNNFSTNFFAHPYHGSTYFNAARTNGLNYWESIPFAFAGSMMWEIYMESEFPSYNDLIATTWGGVALGEALYRFSEQVLDDRSRGLERVGRETAGFLINPVGAFNRLIKGDMFRHTSNVNHMRHSIDGYLALGGRGRLTGSDLGDTEFSPSLEMTLHYGQPFKSKENRKPFDYFTFRFWTSKRDTVRNMTILARAVMIGKDIQGKNGQNHLVGIFQYFDYINLEAFKIGAISFGGALLSKFPLGKDFELITGPSGAGVLLGAGDNEYVTSYQGRNYNYGHGFKGKLDLLVRHPKFGELFADYNYFSFYTREGAPGVDRLHVLNASYLIRIWRSLGVGLEYFYYHRNANYDNDPDVKREIKGLRALIAYHF
ncbi:MAG: DUF3943 domain-containing protein [bacterium]|nr:MAG: DUF3943 domain-containing protein [bacterium]